MAENLDKELVSRKATLFCWVLVVILALYALASAQDCWALADARVRAAKSLKAAGVSRTAIDGGFEYNAWTQLMRTGRLNSRWVKNPPGAYNPAQSQTPVVVPLYRLVFARAARNTPSQFGYVFFNSPLPPFHKQVSIDRVEVSPARNH